MTNFFYFVNRDSSIAIRHSLLFTSAIAIRNSLLNIVFHFPYTAWADTGTEAATDTKFFINYVGIITVFIFISADCAIIAGGLAHVAVSANSTGHAAVALNLWLERLAPAYVIVGGLDFFIGDHGFDCRPVIGTSGK